MKWKSSITKNQSHEIFLSTVTMNNWTKVTVDGKEHEVRLVNDGFMLQIKNKNVIENYRIRSLEQLSSRFGQHQFKISLDGAFGKSSDSKVTLQLYSPLPDSAQNSSKSSSLLVEAPMSGKVLKVMVQNDSKVTEGQCVLIIEAMKMENSIYAPMDGKINDMSVTENEQVSINQKLFKVNK